MKLGYGAIARRRAGQTQIQVPAPNDWLVWWVCLWAGVWNHASTGSHTGQRRLMKSAPAVRCALYSVQGTLFSVLRFSGLQTLSCTCDGAVACFFFFVVAKILNLFWRSTTKDFFGLEQVWLHVTNVKKSHAISLCSSGSSLPCRASQRVWEAMNCQLSRPKFVDKKSTRHLNYGCFSL